MSVTQKTNEKFLRVKMKVRTEKSPVEIQLYQPINRLLTSLLKELRN